MFGPSQKLATNDDITHTAIHKTHTGSRGLHSCTHIEYKVPVPNKVHPLIRPGAPGSKTN